MNVAGVLGLAYGSGRSNPSALSTGLASSRRASQVTSKDGFFRETPESERDSCLGATLSPPLYLDRGEEDNTSPTDAAFFCQLGYCKYMIFLFF
jgi:hypothetical protein